MTGRHRRQAAQAGFTLMESLFATAIAAFVLAGLITSYIFSVKGFRGLANYNQMQEDGRWAVEWLSHDLRFALGISSWSSNSVVVLLPSAINSAGAVTSTDIVTHTLENAAWYRMDANGTTKELATNVNSLAFSLYDQAGNLTTQASQAVSVQVNAFLSQTFLNSTQTVECVSARYRMRNAP